MTNRPETIDDYLTSVPPEAKTALQQLRATIQRIVPDAVEVISYGMPAFKHRGRMLVGFAAFTHHCSFILWSGKTLETHRESVAGYESSKSTVHFAFDKPLPEDLVRRLIEARISENEAAQRANKQNRTHKRIEATK